MIPKQYKFSIHYHPNSGEQLFCRDKVTGKAAYTRWPQFSYALEKSMGYVIASYDLKEKRESAKKSLVEIIETDVN